MDSRTIKKYLLATAVIVIVSTAMVHAQNVNLIEPTILNNGGSGGVRLDTYLENLVPRAFAIAALIAVITYMIAGALYASPTESSKEEGKKYALRATVGLLLLLSSYIILNTINPALVNFDRIPNIVKKLDGGTKLQEANYRNHPRPGDGGGGGSNTQSAGASSADVPSSGNAVPAAPGTENRPDGGGENPGRQSLAPNQSTTLQTGAREWQLTHTASGDLTIRGIGTDGEPLLTGISNVTEVEIFEGGATFDHAVVAKKADNTEQSLYFANGIFYEVSTSGNGDAVDGAIVR